MMRMECVETLQLQFLQMIAESSPSSSWEKYTQHLRPVSVILHSYWQQEKREGQLVRKLLIKTRKLLLWSVTPKPPGQQNFDCHFWVSQTICLSDPNTMHTCPVNIWHNKNLLSLIASLIQHTTLLCSKGSGQFNICRLCVRSKPAREILHSANLLPSAGEFSRNIVCPRKKVDKTLVDDWRKTRNHLEYRVRIVFNPILFICFLVNI